MGRAGGIVVQAFQPAWTWCRRCRRNHGRRRPILPRPVRRETRAELAAAREQRAELATARERAGVRLIPITGCLGFATPDTWYFQSPSPYPLPEYREREPEDTCDRPARAC